MQSTIPRQVSFACSEFHSNMLSSQWCMYTIKVNWFVVLSRILLSNFFFVPMTWEVWLNLRLLFYINIPHYLLLVTMVLLLSLICRCIIYASSNGWWYTVCLQRFAAVIMRIRDPKTTALIFASGKMVWSFAALLCLSFRW